jgi:hypothetical protein
MRISKLSFEGDATEFASVSHLFEPRGEAISSSGSPLQAGSVDQRTTELVERVLTRVVLAESHRALVTAVVEAGDEGILGSELLQRIGLANAQFRGVLGSFGRRVSNTPGWPKEVSFFDWEWDSEAEEWRYYLREPFRSAAAAKI